MDKKSLIGMMLIGAIFVGYTMLFPQEDDAEETTNTELVSESDSTLTDSVVSTVVVVVASMEDSSAVDSLLLVQANASAGAFGNARAERLSSNAKEEFLENDKIKVEFSNAGGQIASVWLKEYQTYDEYKRKNFSKDTIENALQLFDSKGTTIEWTLPGLKDGLTSKDLVFTAVKSSDSNLKYLLTGNGKTLLFDYTLLPGEYQVAMEVTGQGFSVQEMSEIELTWKASMLQTEHERDQQKIVSGIFYNNDEDRYDYMAEGRDDDELIEDNKLKWVAFKQGYFSAMLKSETMFAKGVELDGKHIEDTSSKYIATFSMEANPQLASGVKNNFTWFFGPNDYELLKSYNDGSEDVINWGWGIFRWINKYAIEPIFSLLTKNFGIGFGIAILILTFIVKVVLMPINYKMYTQSAKMKVIKPELEEFNKKWEGKNDKVGKQQAQMKLMGDLGVNQFAGCLPSLAQMPILIAVYRYFPALLNLRQENFLWAEDLSSYDSIFNLGFSIPFYGDHVSLFTLLMAITMFVNTKLTSGQMQQPQQEGMPNMKIIMYMMPVMMLFFFNSYSSGLSYYYFISTLISIVIMYFIKLVLIDENKIRAKIDNNLENPNEKKKSGFQARLAEMQRIQSEQAKSGKKKK